VVTSTDGVESGRLRYRFTDESDSPAAVDSSQDGGATWVSTRYVDVPLLGLVAAVSGSSVSLRIADLHQNIVSSIDRTAGSSSIDYFSSFDEFGVPEASASTQRFGWKGAAERPADSLAGTILMGARVYNPTTGYFLQVDPVRGGGTTTYGYPSDPVNVSGLTGRYFRHRLCRKAEMVFQARRLLERLAPLVVPRRHEVARTSDDLSAQQDR
jgi:RHS repeat-associated protein